MSEIPGDDQHNCRLITVMLADLNSCQITEVCKQVREFSRLNLENSLMQSPLADAPERV